MTNVCVESLYLAKFLILLPFWGAVFGLNWVDDWVDRGRMQVPRMTERVVVRAKPRKKRYEIHCSILAGFMLRVLPSGGKAYYVRFRDAAGKDCRRRLGSTIELSFAEAIARASELLSAIRPMPGGRRFVAVSQYVVAAPGGSVAGSRRPTACPSVREFGERFLCEHVNVRLKPPTQQKYRQMMARNVVPTFGAMRLDELSFADVSRFHASMSHTPYEANANLLLLSSMYHRAVEWGILERSHTLPTRGVKKFATRSRERFLSPEERATLDAFLERGLAIPANQKGHLRWHSVAAIRLLAMTGMRRAEVLDLKWEMVDYRHRCLRLDDSKTGQKVVPVSDDVLTLIRECRQVWERCTLRPRPEYVIYSRMGGRVANSTLTDTWSSRVRDRIPGFERVRLHDLRHSAASDALMAGVPLAVVGKILGHQRPETTARYAHIADSVMSDAVDVMSRAIRHGTKTGMRLVTVKSRDV